MHPETKNRLAVFLIALAALTFICWDIAEVNLDAEPDSIYYELWDISNLDSIGGHPVSVLGDPQIVSTDLGDAVKFDGEDDRLLVDFNPIMDAREFTVELVFKPDAFHQGNEAPRFVHIQDPDDPQGKRVMIELRVNENDECYMDGFINTDAESLALIDETLVHSTEVWQHVAITYKDSILTTYFNGTKELDGIVHYDSAIVNTIGKTSLGGRMNHVAFYAGLMKTLKVSHACLSPEEFTLPEIIDTTTTDTSLTRLSVLPRGINMEFYPVPADRFLKLKLESRQFEENPEICINDLSGRIVYRQVYSGDSDNLSIDTSGFLTGVYLLSIRSEGLIDYGKVLVLH